MTPGFVCKHVSAGAPVLLAVHDEESDPNVTGWSLVCGGDHEDGDYLIVNLDRYAAKDSSLIEILTLPENTVASRAKGNQPWIIEALGVTPETELAN